VTRRITSDSRAEEWRRDREALMWARREAKRRAWERYKREMTRACFMAGLLDVREGDE